MPKELTFKISRPSSGVWHLRASQGRVMTYFGQHNDLRAIVKQIEALSRQLEPVEPGVPQ